MISDSRLHRGRGKQILLNVVLLVVFLLQASGLIELPGIARFENMLYDLRVQSLPARGMDDRIVIVDIDESSLRQLGRWPWRRGTLADFVTVLHRDYKVAALGFDAVFADPDMTAWLWPALEQDADPAFRRQLALARGRLDQENRFAESLGLGPSVLGFYFNFQAERTGVLPRPLLAGATLPRPAELARIQGYGGNLAHLQAHALGGYFNALSDSDGVVRRLPLILGFEGGTYPSLALALAQASFPGEARLFDRSASTDPALGLRLGDIEMPLNADGTIYIPYRPQPGFRYVSAVDVLNHEVPMEVLDGRIALVGSSAPGLADLRVTPIGNLYPGVEIQANVIGGILDGALGYRPRMARHLDLAVTLSLGLVIALSFIYASPRIIGLVLLVGIALLLAGHGWAWRQHWLLPLAGQVLMLGVLILGNAAYGFFAGLAERRAKQRLAQLFSQYVPPELVERMQHDPHRFTMRSEARVLTVLFSDIRGFTSLSEQLSPAQLADMLNAYLSEMTGLIYAHKGTVDKYIGDAIMAFWGAPVDNPAHADDAVRTALAMRVALMNINKAFRDNGWPEIKIGIGLNTGPMTVGNLGSRYRIAYTVVSDAVNLASRLEGATKQYGIDILVGEDTVQLTRGITYLEVDRIRVKGKQQPVTIYWPVGETETLDDDTADTCTRFARLLEHYRAGRLDRMAEEMSHLARPWLTPVLETYRERLGRFKTSPPPDDWDGVWTLDSK